MAARLETALSALSTNSELPTPCQQLASHSQQLAATRARAKVTPNERSVELYSNWRPNASRRHFRN